jgi:hypothetical protein
MDLKLVTKEKVSNHTLPHTIFSKFHMDWTFLYEKWNYLTSRLGKIQQKNHSAYRKRLLNSEIYKFKIKYTKIPSTKLKGEHRLEEDFAIHITNKRITWARCWWLMPVSLAPWETEIRRILVPGQTWTKKFGEPSQWKKAGSGSTLLSSQLWGQA